MNPFEMVVMIVAIVMIASVVKHRRGGGRMIGVDPGTDAENARLRAELSELKERLKVIERITVDKESSLSRQIDELRDR